MIMRLGFLFQLLLVVIICASANLKAETLDWREVSKLEQSLREAERRNDFEGAAKAAEKCVAVTKNSDAAFQRETGQPYCARYLAMALRDGKGIKRDEIRAFAIIRGLAAKSDWQSLDLVEAYLDGMGTPRDHVEAGVIFWRVDHGFLSIYSDYWGMCNECEADYSEKEILRQRIERELTPEEKQKADAISLSRFPEIAARVRERDSFLATIIMSSVIAISLVVIFILIRSRRRLT